MALSKRSKAILALAAAGLAFLAHSAFAQVPPHQPGTICFTATFWCWANPPGPPGNPCGCPSPYGYVSGYLN